MQRILGLVVFLGLVTQVQSQVTSCSNGQEESTQCLQGIKATLTNKNRFWFGTPIWQTCRPGVSDLFCLTVPSELRWGSSLVEAVPGILPGQVDRFLTVTYTAPRGSYEGCDTTLRSSTQITFSLNPLSTTVTYPNFFARSRPALSWSQGTPVENVKYTLLVLDVGYGNVQAVYSNIAGGSLAGGTADITNADEVIAYTGPKNPFYEVSNPYVFLLFKQPSMANININPADFSTPFFLQNRLATFIITYALAGPVAVNWLVADGDIYGLSFQNQRLSNCASYVQRELSEAPHKDRAFINAQSALSVFIHVEISVPEIDFTFCCIEKSKPANHLTLDPIANPTFDGVNTRTGATLSVSFQKTGQIPVASASTLTGEIHTLLVVDPDVPSPSTGTETQPILHLMVTNIRNGVFELGDVLASYRGPRPPDGPHVYYFLLYKQRAMSSFNYNTVKNTYIKSTTCDWCLLDIVPFVADNNLELVGATWMTVRPDDYVEWDYIQGGRPASAYCSGVPGWVNETCPDGTVTEPPVETTTMHRRCFRGGATSIRSSPFSLLFIILLGCFALLVL